MNSLKILTQQVLQKIEPDPSKWSQWLEHKPIYPVSASESMRNFVALIHRCKADQIRVFVAGDYDCDGIMATTIMVDGLKRFGLDVGFYIPDRIKEGYGLSEETVTMVHKRGYRCIITVDNGVKAVQALEKAKELGLITIVTDHHTIDQEVNCDCLVHPDTMESCFSTLCGAGVAFECLRALRLDTAYTLELAAVASIGDVMQVTGETRSIIQQGLALLNQDREQHLMGLASDRMLNEISVAFQIVPQLNAVGRLSNLANVNNVVRYFLSNQPSLIRSMQLQISQLNQQRKNLSEQMVKTACDKCEQQEDVLMVCDDSFHEGIIGLVAGTLCTQFSKPAIVLTKNQEGYKASMRSPDGFDCMDFLSDYKGFQAFGGHAQAAGFSFDLHSYSQFRSYVRERIASFDWSPDPLETLLVDPSALTVDEIESLDCLRPFGPGFVCPLFEIKDPKIQSITPIQNGKHCRYTLLGGLECMKFNQSDADRQMQVTSIRSLIGKVQISQYRGRKKATFVIEKMVSSQDLL